MVPGQQIAPTLKLVRPLAQGAMGSVWIAEHLALGAQVAVKFMSPALAGDPDLVTRFQHEAMMAARVKSPHVAQVFDHGIAADGSPYIVMELLEGESLARRVNRLGPLPPGEVALIVAQAAKALGPAHRLGIVHRDIKPDNLFLLDVEGELFVKVLDFGVAKQRPGEGLTLATSTGILLGTPLYISPEQSRSARRVDFRADLWSLGAVAYHALTGRPPFVGQSLAALLIAVNEGVFTPPSHLRPGLPPEVDAWMARALQRDPEARFGSAGEMAEALALAVHGPGAAPAAPEPAPAPEAPAEPVRSDAAAPAAIVSQQAGHEEARTGTLQGVATAATGPRALRRPLLLAGAALGAAAVVVTVMIGWLAGGAAPPAAQVEAKEMSAAPDLETSENAPTAPPGDTVIADAGQPDGPASAPERAPVQASSPTTAGGAPARSGGLQSDNPRPSRSSSRKKAREDDIGF